ncbi:DUF3955 domain-containing protein [Cyanobium sp. HWJ4-Hawea]|uniref:DUF3955 domain-containing protein n=1 Tax=Cyanobium sp. HWJ4-Hawea TaxID=2823713 RepID=UPI0020CCC26E|nr:DUF3955 domain-containing protein [Cyanobium sp. HWJ4-Hawea]MCP9809682.1 DUF3955 domain-containing protein [Cyanobium sp. HWJ4-Hawea]
MKFRPLALTSLVLFGAMVGCWVGFRAIGGQVGRDGSLREPFVLVPLGYLAGAAGLVCLGAAGANLRHDSRKDSRKD